MRLLKKILRGSMVLALILTTMLISNTSQVSAASSGSLDQWSIRSPFVTQNVIRSTCYGNNTFVAVGYNGTILTSPDGVIWTPQTSGITNHLYGVSYGNSTFVAVGESGTILTSPDGVIWITQTSGTTNLLLGVSYGNSTFVAVGDIKTVLTSPDGVTWTTRTSGTTYHSLFGVSYGNSTFVAVGGSGKILTSPDGVTWTPQTSGFIGLLLEVSYGNSTFVAVGEAGLVQTSPDGVTWTLQTSGTNNSLYGVSYGNSTFVAVGTGGTVLTSPDGVTWTPQTSGITNSLFGVSYGNSTFVAMGNSGTIFTSPDGVTWTTAGTTTDLSGVSYGNSTFVAVGYDGVILTSPDEVTWTPQTSGTTKDLYEVSYGNNTFVAVGSGGTVLTSPDGVTWITQTSGTTNLLLGVSYGNSTFVVVGDVGIILTSPDGETWTLQDYSMSTLWGVSYGNSTFVAVGPFGHIRTSPDGVTWTLRAIGNTTYSLYGVSYGSSTFVAVGSSGTVLTSSDGVTWTRQTSGFIGLLLEVSYGNSTFVAVGDTGTILTSPDGETWTSKTSGITNNLRGVSYVNSTFVAVGHGGYIIQSGTFTTYTVTLNSGTASPSTAGENTTVTITANTAPDGKQFKEWTVESGGVTLASTTSLTTTFTMPANAVEITATYEDLPASTYAITVQNDGNGTANANVNAATQGTEITLTATPSSGYQFKEWQVVNGGVTLSNAADTTFIMPANGVVVKAIFEVIPVTNYTVTYNLNGGTRTGGGELTQSVLSGGSATAPTVTRSGYTFAGWDKDFTNVTGDLTVTATWSLNGGHSVTVTNGTGSGEYAEDASVTITADAAQEGKQFDGWTIDPSNVNFTEGSASTPTAKFSMPAESVTATAEYTDIVAGTYAINVLNDGHGMGSANVYAVAPDTEITLIAIPDNGYQFTEWQVISGDVTITNNQFTMPAENVTVKAMFEQVPAHQVTFDLNGGTRTGGGELTQTVANGGSATAPIVTRSGYTFSGWDKTFSNVTGDLTITAAWHRNGGGSSSGGGSSTPATPEAPAPTISGSTATTTVTAKTGSDGKAAASVTQSQVNSAIESAQKAAKNNGEAPKVEIQISGASNTSTVETTLPKAAVQALGTGKMESLTISSPVADMTFDAQAIAAIAGAASGDVSFTASNVENSTLSDTARQVVGDRPVYDFSVTSGSKTISQFNGTVTLSLPYTPAKGEDTSAIVAYYINKDGKAELMQNCYYDAEAGALVFTTDHFSQYAVGYNKVAFSDVSDTAWYADAISYLAAREITSGITETTFGPGATLTRGQFITLLLRAYGIDADENPTDNFADAGNTYYTGYLATVKRLEISSGVGDNKFAPKQAITRQEMFTLLYNALKAIDRLPEDDSGKALSDFTDSGNVSSYAQEALTYLVKTGTVGGNNGQLNPRDTTTRAQMAQVLYNLLSE